MEKDSGLLERVFHLSENGTSVKTEIMAGITTFMTMAYILAVNPSIMSTTGMDKGAVLTATAIAGFIGTILMAAFANYPFALAPGMGLNAFFAFTVVQQMGYTWEMALAAVFVEGMIFIILSLTNVREAIFNAIPLNLKRAVSAGIGLFIAFIGLCGAQIIVANPATKISLFSFKQAMLSGTFQTTGITVVLAILGVLFTGILMVKRVKGNILWGILFTWILGILCEVSGLYVPDPSKGAFSTLPNLSNGLASFTPASLSPLFMELDFSQVATFNFVVVLLAFLFVDIFDTLGTLIGVSSKANMLDAEGKLPRIKGALMADAVATSIGSVLGVSTTTTYVESAAGVSEGGRTGLTAVTVAVLFLLSLFFSPFFMAIPAFATAPALITVGFLMFTAVAGIDFNDMTEAIPCYLAVIAMPFAYSIAEGIAFGVISYTIINLIAGKREKVSPLMMGLTVVFILKYIFL
ncbi:MAG TPA: guanine permease [Dialister sp.]|nr:guanine permease [Dialister sp.]